jgi:hypothetical protein
MRQYREGLEIEKQRDLRQKKRLSRQKNKNVKKHTGRREGICIRRKIYAPSID